jgi:hypothetical protein
MPTVLPRLTTAAMIAESPGSARKPATKEPAPTPLPSARTDCRCRANLQFPTAEADLGRESANFCKDLRERPRLRPWARVARRGRYLWLTRCRIVSEA